MTLTVEMELPSVLAGWARPMSHQQVGALALERGQWLVPDLIHRSSTLLYGMSESGKSSVAGNLVASALLGRPFLGKYALSYVVTRVVLLVSEVSGEVEYRERLARAGVGEDEARLLYIPVDGPGDAAQWQALAEFVRPDNSTLVIADNLSRFVPDGLNDDVGVNAVFTGLNRFVSQGACVVVLAHVSDSGLADRKRPQGNSAVTQNARWRVLVAKARGNDQALTLETFGNASNSRQKLTLSRGEHILDFTVLSGEDQLALAQQADTDKREHEAAQWEQWRRIAREAVDHFGGRASQVDMAAWITQEYQSELGVKASVVETWLSKGIRLGQVLVKEGKGVSTVWTVRD